MAEALNILEDYDLGALSRGKRPRSSMSPTIVLDDGTPVTAFGSPGEPSP